MRVAVCGAGGFIGGHLSIKLKALGYDVRAVDIKPLNEWYQLDEENENWSIDLRSIDLCRTAVEGCSEVYNLAAAMGGMGFIENNKALCMLNVLINTNVLEASRENKVKRFFFSSSACAYSMDKQDDPNNPGLKESDAYPAMPEDGYGWEKLFSERMCRHFMEDFGIETRVARFHQIYGPFGTFEGGKEKVPAAICRKAIDCRLTGNPDIQIWGDGIRTRSFTYIDDCVEGVLKIMRSDIREPVNLGSSEMVSINQLVDLVESFDPQGQKLNRIYDLNAPQGVVGRNSDNTLIKHYLDWEPTIRLEYGLRETYKWIYSQMLEERSISEVEQS